jgi:hypothetical protein
MWWGGIADLQLVLQDDLLTNVQLWMLQTADQEVCGNATHSDSWL